MTVSPTATTRSVLQPSGVQGVQGVFWGRGWDTLFGKHARDAEARDAEATLFKSTNNERVTYYLGNNHQQIANDWRGSLQVGFGNPAVVAAIKNQLDELPFCTRR